MKKIAISVIAAVVLTTSASADLNTIIKDITETFTSMSTDAKDSANSTVTGTVEVSKTGERTTTAVSKDSKDAGVKLSDDL